MAEINASMAAQLLAGNGTGDDKQGDENSPVLVKDMIKAIEDKFAPRNIKKTLEPVTRELKAKQDKIKEKTNILLNNHVSFR